MGKMLGKASFVAALVALVVAGGAWAGGYHVYTCRTPWGQSAPADGWSPSKSGAIPYDSTVDTCEEGGALFAALRDQVAHPANIDTASWAFSAPTDTTITAATLWRAGDTDGGADKTATYQFSLSAPTQLNFFDVCIYSRGCEGKGELGVPFSPANRWVLPSTHLGSHIYISAECIGVSEYECQSGKGDKNGYAAVVYLYAADITLAQEAQPSASGVSGELASAPAVSGLSAIAFSASDTGAGVYEAVFEIDGSLVQATPVDENGGRCRNVGAADGLPAFLYVQPCRQSLTVDVPFDTTKVANGVHRLVVRVLDAAGNTAPVLDRQITISNPVPPTPRSRGQENGQNASDQATLTARWRTTTRTRATSRYGHPQQVVGRLTAPSGQGIAGASVDVSALPDSVGARSPISLPSPRTGPDGSWSMRLPKGISSCTLRFGYRSHLADTAPVATSTLSLTVRARLVLRVTPHVVGAGRSITLRGRLGGGPIPPGGKQLVLEARSPGGAWIEFHVLRTDAHGRFHFTYRFRFPGPVAYRFRAISRFEADYPFAAAASNAVGVFER
jgi:hypothetical protein